MLRWPEKTPFRPPVLTKALSHLDSETMSPSKPNHDSSANNDYQKHLASHCRRILESEKGIFEFLHQPFRYSFVQKSAARTPTATHLLKIVAPALQGDLEITDHIIDRGEPLVTGMELAIRQIFAHHDWNSDLAKHFVLQSLIPLYLIAGPRDCNALCHSLCLLQETVVIMALDQALEHDLSHWVRQRNNGWDPTSGDLKAHFNIDLPSLTQEIWNRPLHRDGKEYAGVQLDRSRLNDGRRSSFWQITKQWLSDSKQISPPAELALEKISWTPIRKHYSELVTLISKTDYEAPVVEFMLAAPFQLIEQCESAVEEALREESSTLSNEPAGMIGGPSPDLSSVTRSKSKPAPSHNDDDSQISRADSSVLTAIAELSPIDSMRVVEIRSSNDPKLVSCLDQQLGQCRVEQGSMALIVARTVEPEYSVRPEGLLQPWQGALVDYLCDNTEDADLRGFINPQGEIAIVVEDLDRQSATALVREALQAASNAQRNASGIGDDSFHALISGISVVSAPARSFKIQQLIDAAWRCLDGAANQGAGSVKSLEVY